MTAAAFLGTCSIKQIPRKKRKKLNMCQGRCGFSWYLQKKIQKRKNFAEGIELEYVPRPQQLFLEILLVSYLLYICIYTYIHATVNIQVCYVYYIYVLHICITYMYYIHAGILCLLYIYCRYVLYVSTTYMCQSRSGSSWSLSSLLGLSFSSWSLSLSL